MTTHPRARPGRLVITAVRAAALLGVLVLVTACGSSSRDETASAADPQQALAFARCMRANGVPDFPDPDPDGRFPGQRHEQQDTPKFQAATEACRSLAPGGEHEKTDPATVEQMRQFSQCMRDSGVPDFPDPDPDGRLRGAGHEQQGNPTFRAAMQTCRQKLPGGGDHQ